MNEIVQRIPKIQIQFEKTMLLYQAALDEVLTRINILNREFKIEYSYSPIEHISSRIKSPKSIYKKLQKNHYPMTIENIMNYVEDVAGIRIVCKFISDIYALVDLLEKQHDFKIIMHKDYIKNQKESGYQSYHLIISIPVTLQEGCINTKVEIQIRTIAMDFWASIEHKIRYKYEKEIPSHIKRELRECADIVSFLDKKMAALNDEVHQEEEDQNDSYEDMIESLRLMIENDLK
ncbi:MAG: GTP pyrophosphokinase family protein [Traorella sp.]